VRYVSGDTGATINITVDGVNNNSTAFKSGGTRHRRHAA